MGQYTEEMMAKDDPVGALLGMVLQHCTVETVIQSERTPTSWYYVMHSGHISANADAMRVLGAFGKIKITHDGRGTRWVEGVCRMEADDAEWVRKIIARAPRRELNDLFAGDQQYLDRSKVNK